jgi:opacity protein-like surface antigen
MKKLTTSLLALAGLASALQAGDTTVSSGKESKEIAPIPVEEPCFKANEWQFDTFGQYSVGNSGRAGLFREHGWGGGVGFNYFFHRNIGLGIDASWLAAREDSGFARNDNSGGRTAIHNFSGSVIFRLPIDHTCLAPYIYAGGGFHVDGEQWASAHGGIGLEYRIKPNRLGIFIDGRWTYLGDRDDRNDLNFFSARAGIRIIF